VSWATDPLGFGMGAAARMKLLQQTMDDRALLATILLLHQADDAARREPPKPPIAMDLANRVMTALATSAELPRCTYCRSPWPCTTVMTARVLLDILGMLDGTFSDTGT
jgi:hypothetical protein